MVYFVGAGPGAPDLITLRGAELLEQADVIVYAGSLVNPELLKRAKPGCDIHNSASMTLEEVLAVLVRANRENRLAVRLHTGDPSLYGVVREQMDRLRRESVPFEVVPGVSSFLAAAASLQVEYTLPGVGQTVILTRLEGRTPVPEREALQALAAHRTAMAIFLSGGMAAEVQQRLLEGGYLSDTSVAVVYKASWEDERILRTHLEQLSREMEQSGIRKTALILVGDFLGDEYELSKLYDAAFTHEFRKGTEA